ncbi:putative lipase atg15 [Tilletia horrida]|nr:putative lipase atg15 [Tilletia horrida]
MTRPKMRRLALTLTAAAAAAAGLGATGVGAAPTPNQWTPLSLAQYLQQSIFDAIPKPAWSPFTTFTDEQPLSQPSTHSFTLRHSVLHPLLSDEPRKTFLLNRTANAQAIASAAESTLFIKTKRQRVLRPADPHGYLAALSQCSIGSDNCPDTTHSLKWDEVDIDAPDVTNRETLLAFARMSSQAYMNDTSGWEPGFGGFNLSDSFGWEEDGMRGHVFTSNDNSTIILAIKGTSPPFFPGGTDTVRRDKENDTCSAVGGLGPFGPAVPSDFVASAGLSAKAPAAPTQQCAQTCLERALVEKSFYYPAAMDLYNNVSYLYPDSQIWITGHSLGGSLSALLGMTFGVPTVTFEAPGERMAAQRLHLPLPPTGPDSDESPVAKLPITHVYHTADPIAMGDCQGTGTICSTFGYAMESRCHTGKSIIYDTVKGLGWSSSINSHRISFLTDDLLTEDWDKKVAAKGKKASVVAAPVQGREGWRVVERRRTEMQTTKWKWPWQRGDKGDGDKDKEDPDGPEGDLKRAVPKARNEDACRDCADWKFADKF